uniref:PotA protein n=1 Tax=Fopius arisanus TaxID=64838 RepID=A0A0C9RDY3_9HYME
MKFFLVAFLCCAILLDSVYSQDNLPSGNAPEKSADDNPQANTTDSASQPKVQGSIDIEGIKCLCNLQASGDSNGNSQASVAKKAECGLGDPAPTLSLDCDVVLNGDISGSFFYILEVERNSIWGGGSWVRFDYDADGIEITALNFPKGLDTTHDLKIVAGGLAPVTAWQATLYKLEDQKKNVLNLCNNTEPSGSWEDNLLRMSQQIILDGRDCPIEEGAKTSVVLKPPQPLPPAIYMFPEMLICDRLSWNVKMRDPGGSQAFQVWYDFTPKGVCRVTKPQRHA